MNPRMPATIIIAAITIYSANTRAQSSCANLFERQNSTHISELVTFTGTRGVLTQKAITLHNRLTQALEQAQNTREMINLRNTVASPEFKSGIRSTQETFESLLSSIKAERQTPNSYYAKLSETRYLKILELFENHIQDLNQLAQKDFPYRETVYLAYRSSLLYQYLKTEDINRVDRNAYKSISRDQLFDFTIQSRTLEEAISYSKVVKNEITENIEMLDYVLKDPLTTLYMSRDLPSIETLNKAAPTGLVFVSYNERLASIHRETNYPPYFLTYHDIVHAFNISKIKNDYLRKILKRDPTLSDYKKAKANIEQTLRALLNLESSISPEKKDYFHAIFNALTHDFVPRLYHFSGQYKKINSDYRSFAKFRRETIERALSIYTEQMKKTESPETRLEIEGVFDEIIFRSMTQIEQIQFQ